MGLGLTFCLGPVEAAVSYLHVFELPVDGPEGGSAIVQQRPASPCVRPYGDAAVCDPVGAPSGPQVGAGRYRADASLLAFGLRTVF